MNSVAPDTKRAAASAIEAAGGRYVDVAVMAPVHPARLGRAAAGQRAACRGRRATAAAALGFTDVAIVGDAVGRASTIKMLRSVMVKGHRGADRRMLPRRATRPA